MTIDTALLAAEQYTFQLRFYRGTQYGSAPSWTDITEYVTGVSNIWYGYRGDATVGWEASIEGVSFFDTSIATGKTFKCEVRSYVSGAWGAWGVWFTGVIMPETVSIDYTNERWSLTVVDTCYFATRKYSPILSVGKVNLLTDASVQADSVNTAQIVNDPLEFAGEPSLSPEMVVDGDMSTLWVSQKAPAANTIAWPEGVESFAIGVNEVWKPTTYYDADHTFWIELFGPKETPGDVAIMTRSGIVIVKQVTYGDLADDDDDRGYAIVTYDGETYKSLFGGASDVPVFQWKNSDANTVIGPYTLTGSISGYNLGFNADGLGDYIAISDPVTVSYYPAGRSHFAWRTGLVVNGTKTTRADSGTFSAIAADGTYADITTTTSWSLNELAGCFMFSTAGSIANNKMRYIASNTATVAGVTRVTFETAWVGTTAPWDYEPAPGDNYKLTGYPYVEYSSEAPYPWVSYGGQLGIDNATWGAGASCVRYVPGHEISTPNDRSNFKIDTSPQPGQSGYSGDSSMAWVIATPMEIMISLAQDLSGGTTVTVDGTTGLLPSGSVYIGGYNAAYTSKTSTTITLASAWGNPTQPAGTRVYQYEDGAATALWPMHEFKIRRKQVPLANGTYRTIASCVVYGTLLDNPRTPETNPDPPESEEDWRNDWQNDLAPDGSAIFSVSSYSGTEISFHVKTSPGYIRLKSVLIGIRQMSDESYARINELEIYPPESVINDANSDVDTVSEFLEWALLQCNLTDVTIVDGSEFPIGSFSTDGSPWNSILDDFARRTGQVIIAEMNDTGVIIMKHPAWPYGSTRSVSASMSRSNAVDVTRTRMDDYSIAQVRVRVIGSDDNSMFGVYPPEPRAYGDIIITGDTYHSETNTADDIARMLFQESTQPQYIIKTVGPALQAMPASDRLLISFGDITADVIVSDVTHSVQLGPADRHILSVIKALDTVDGAPPTGGVNPA